MIDLQKQQLVLYLKVIPLKRMYYPDFSQTWHN